MSRPLRTLLTLLVLVLMLGAGVAWGWSKVSKPFPKTEDPPVCEDLEIKAGEKVYPDQVTVSVYNAGRKVGAAGNVLDALNGKGFVRGSTGDAEEDTKVGTAEIWTEDKSNPSVQLLRSYFGKGVKVVERDTPEAGLTVVVGDDFKRLVKGRKALPVPNGATVCGPSADEPTDGASIADPALT